MQFALMLEPQEGTPYRELRELAVRAEAAGFDALFRSDHWLSLEGSPSRPASDAWTTIAGLARETRTIRLGTLVSPITFRLPVGLAKIVATVDEMSEGRVEVGIGAGWHRPEHESFGIPFPPMGERFDRLDEYIQVVKALWTEPRATFDGRFYALRDAICQPKPVQRPHPTLIVGGLGRRRTVDLAARHADELNLDMLEPAACIEAYARLDAACAAAGRDPGTVRRSVMIPWPAGPAEDQRAAIASYERAGAQRLYLNVGAGPSDPETVSRFGREVIGAR
jgi:F420-dependent oxidoreductase-like protein